MFIINLLTWASLIGFPAYGLTGGSGNILFTGIIIAVSGLLIKLISSLLFGSSSDMSSVVGVSQLIIFLLLCIAAFPLGAFINRLFQINFEPFDFMLGSLLGIASAIYAIHLLLSFLLTACAGTPLFHTLQHAFVVRQFFYFDGWHKLTAYMLNLDSDKQPITTPE